MKNSLSHVSIIIPIYNEEKYIKKCLDSIFDQTYKRVEAIVIDDGSTDKSMDVVKGYNIKILTQHHSGSGAARNLGAKYAKGEILAFLDADMKYDRNYVEKLIEPIIKKKAFGTFNKEERVANPKNIWSKCWSINSGLPFDRRLPEDYPETENAFRAILKNVFDKGKGFEINEGYMDDSSLSRKIDIKAINAPGAVSYHYNPSTLVEVFYSARWIGRSINFKPTLENFLRYSPLNSLRVAFKFYLSKAPLRFFIFKVIYDFAMLNGIFIKRGKIYK